MVVVDDVLATGRRAVQCYSYEIKLASVQRTSALWSWPWPSFLFSVVGNCCAGVVLAEPPFKAFCSLVVLRKGREGCWWMVEIAARKEHFPN